MTALAPRSGDPGRRACGPRLLGPRTLRALSAVTEAIFATEQGPPPKARVDWVRDGADDFLARAGRQPRLVYRLALLAVSILGPALVFRLTPLWRLSLAVRITALTRLEKSWASPPLFAVKALLCVLYYEHPDAAREVGFDGA